MAARVAGMSEVQIPAGFLKDWCEVMSHGTELAPESYLATGLAISSAIAGPRVSYRWVPTSGERAMLWILTVGRSALGRKTSGLRAARAAVGWAQEVLGDQMRWYAPKRLSDAGVAVDLDVVTPDTASAQREEERQAKNQGRDPEPMEPVHRTTPVGFLIALNEAVKLWTDRGERYEENARTLLMEAYDGMLSSSTRNTSVPEQECALTVVGNIPPDVMADQTSVAMLRSGWAGRWVILPSPPPLRPVAIPKLNGTVALARLAETVRMLARLVVDEPPVQNAFDLWTPEANEVRVAWYDPTWHKLNTADARDVSVAVRADLWNRLQSTACRLAFHAALSRHLGRIASLRDVQVEPVDVEWGQGIVDASLEDLLGIVEESGGGARTPVARAEHRVLRFLTTHGHTSEENACTMKRVSDACKGPEGRSEVERAVRALVQTESVQVKEVPWGKRTRAWVWADE